MITISCQEKNCNEQVGFINIFKISDCEFSSLDLKFMFFLADLFLLALWRNY